MSAPTLPSNTPKFGGGGSFSVCPDTGDITVNADHSPPAAPQSVERLGEQVTAEPATAQAKKPKST